jgi:hypothetical protein
MRKEKNMEQVIKHYGNAILAVLVLLGLGAIILGTMSSGGVVATGISDMLGSFFADMKALT